MLCVHRVPVKLVKVFNEICNGIPGFCEQILFDLLNKNEIYIVDDNNELRAALEEIISMSDGYKCMGTMSTAREAIRKLPSIRPDVVLMDINLGSGETGIDCVRELKPIMQATNFMMCTVYEEDEKIFEALNAGASGYILKKTAPNKLL